MPPKPRSTTAERKDREQHNLADRITRSGIEMLACSRCRRSGSLCIVASEESKRCAVCVRAGRTCDVDKPVPAGPSSGDWKRLAETEDRLDEETDQAEAALAEVASRQAELAARLLRLRKQRKLLKRRGAEMLRRGFRSLEELERLEESEKAAPIVPSAPEDFFPLEEPLPDFSDPYFWVGVDLGSLAANSFPQAPGGTSSGVQGN